MAFSRNMRVIQRVALCLTFLLHCSVSFAQAQSSAGGRAGERPCSLLQGTASQRKAPTPADLLRAYNAQVHLFRSIHMVGTMRGSSTVGSAGKVKQRELAAIIDLMQPDMLRINGIVPYAGNRIVDLTSDGKDFGLLVPGEGDKKRFFFGPVDAPARAENPWENMRPGPFLLALRWEEGAIQTQARQQPGELKPAVATLDIDIPGHRRAMPSSVRAWFDLDQGVVNRLTVYDASDAPIFETYYSDWRTRTAPSGDGSDECYPRQIQIVDKRLRFEVEIHINEVTLNMDMPRSIFRLMQPRGVPMTRLDGPDH